jgi:hypothetical protein
MLSPKEYISLEAACSSIKASQPELLEGLARLLLGGVDAKSRFDYITVCVVENGKPNPEIGLTYQDIGKYLTAATGKHVPVLLEAESGAIESGRIFVQRNWISRQIADAAKRLSINPALAEPAANQTLSIVQSVNSGRTASWVDQPAPMTADGYKNLHRWLRHQNDQRKANESASKIRIELQFALARAEKAETIVLAKSAEIAVLENRDRLSILELSAKQRTIQSQKLEIKKLQEKLEISGERGKGPRRQPAKKRAIMAVHEMAARLWAWPEFEHYRIGEMARHIKGNMAAEYPEHAGAMPELTSTVVKWLKQMDGIPATACLPGRPPKSKK